MHLLHRVRPLLLRIGVTPACAWVLLFYAGLVAGMESLLPPGETLIRNPFFDVALQGFFALCCLGFLLVRDIKKQPRWRDLLAIILAFILSSWVLYTFCYVKSLIPYMHPYALDPLLQRVDLWLHGGKTPFEWFAPHLSDRQFLWIDILYFKPWFLGLMLYMLWQSFAIRQPVGRAAFLSSFMMTWILLGNGLATLLSSVGPTYYPLFYQDAFTAMNQALLDRIYAIHAQFPLADAVGNREQLLDWYRNATLIDLNVMSSMPSLHTAICILTALHSWRFHRWLCVVTIPYTLLVFFGSFMLGWHYAVDTYVSGICVYAIWRLNRWQAST